MAEEVSSIYAKQKTRSPVNLYTPVIVKLFGAAKHESKFSNALTTAVERVHTRFLEIQKTKVLGKIMH